MDGIADLLRLPARIFAAIAAVAGLILFVPPARLAPVGLDGLAKGYRVWVGLVFLLSVAIFVAEVVITGWKMFRDRRAMKQAAEAAGEVTSDTLEKGPARARQARLSGLTSDEKDLLREYVGRDVRALNLPFRDGTVMGLVGQGILVRPSQFLNFETREPTAQVLIQPWALGHLREHPELLD